jgi:hypothetical protein
MNNQPYVPPIEVRQRLSTNLKKTELEVKDMKKSLNELIAHLDAEIAAQPQRKTITKLETNKK